ncbi:hypothetical protein Tco_1274442 [Tanacetum coccineum]
MLMNKKSLRIFSGTNGEDAVEHIEYFFKIFDPINLPNVNCKRLRLVVFPISLVGDASKWFDEIKGSITTWVDLTEFFFRKCHSPSHTCDVVGTKAMRDPTNNMFEEWRWDNYENAIHDHDEQEYEEEKEDKERCELHDDLAQEPQNCKIRRYEMIKYSFGHNKEYVAIKEYEYDDLTRTNKDACHAYQEIFRNMDEGWLVTKAE